MTGEEIVLDNVVGGEIIKIKHSLMKVVCEHFGSREGGGGGFCLSCSTCQRISSVNTLSMQNGVLAPFVFYDPIVKFKLLAPCYV